MESPKLKYAGQQARVRRGLITIQVWITPGMRKRLKVAAIEHGVAMSDFVAELIADALKNKKGNAS